MSLILEHEDSRSLVEQIHGAIVQRIVSGGIEPQARLPATRVLARELDVSRTTVVHAYEQLVAEGFIVARRGAGYFACDVGDLEAYAEVSKRRGNTGQVQPMADADPARRDYPGLPDMRLFPHAAWAKHVARSARLSAQSMLSTPDPFGLHRLREAVAGHLSSWRGIETTPEQIIITAGASDALELALRALANRDRCVALESPTYRPLYRMVEEKGLGVHWLNVGEAGALLPPETVRAQVTVLTPSFQFPLGGVMPHSQRLAFLERAERDDGWIIEDDFDSEFRYAGRPIPALASLGGGKRVIYVGSFSKIFSTSLRMGYTVIPRNLLPVFGETIRQFGSRVSIVPQWPIATFIEDGSFHRHIRRMRRIYGERRQAFVDRLRTDLPTEVAFADHRAGMQIALHFPSNWNDQSVSEEVSRLGVNCLPLSDSFFGPTGRSGLLLGFCTVPVEEANERVDALLSVLDNPQQQRPD